MVKKQGIDPTGEYSLNEALRLSPVKSFQTIRRYVDKGLLVAVEKKHGYSIKGSDLIEFIKKIEKGTI